MNIKILIHKAEEGGFWAEAPSLPGCVSQGETKDEVLANIQEAIELWLETDIETDLPQETESMEIVV